MYCLPLGLLPDFPRSKYYQVMQVGSLETFCLLWSLLLGIIRWSQSRHLWLILPHNWGDCLWALLRIPQVICSFSVGGAYWEHRLFLALCDCIGIPSVPLASESFLTHLCRKEWNGVPVQTSAIFFLRASLIGQFSLLWHYLRGLEVPKPSLQPG